MEKMSKFSFFSSSSPKFHPSSPSSFTSYPPSPLHQVFTQTTMEEAIERAEVVIKKWDPNTPSFTKIVSLFNHSRKEAKEFIRCVRDLRKAMHFLVSQDSQSPQLALAQTLMQIAMTRLEKEFFQILSSNREKLDPESVSGQSSTSTNSEFEDFMQSDDEFEDDLEMKKSNESITKVEKASAVVMSDLKAIAECMISCGYGKECIKIYKRMRKAIIDEGLSLLGIEAYKGSRFHRTDWVTLEHMIKNWIKVAKIGVTTLFRGEKLLCDHVFSASNSTRESCFYEIANEAATNLFKFPEFVAKEKKSHERIFSLMDLMAAISDLWRDIEMIFHFDSVSGVKSQALTSIEKLKVSIHSALTDFESTIHKDSTKSLTPGGGIHKLTRSTMSFMSSLCEHNSVLSEILADHPLPINTRLLESYVFEGEEHSLALSVHLAWLILVLLCKLDTKAEHYKDVSLSYLFLANNLHFIVETVRSSHLRDLLGEDWYTKHDDKLSAYAANYEISAWSYVYMSLPEEPTDLSPEEAKIYFRNFHTAFEEAYMKQSSRVVPDARLRDELKVSIAKKLVPEYREFYRKYLPMLGQEKNIEMLVRFKPDNLENYLSDLFHGTPILASSSVSSSSSSSSSWMSLGRVLG